MEKGSILLVEDEENIAGIVKVYLEREGYAVVHCVTGEEGLDAFSRSRPRLVLLDVGLPGIDGIEVCRRIRNQAHVPVIMLTARDSEVDKVLGLEIGADDYVTKPFSPRELLARVKAVLRRTETELEVESIEVSGYTIDRGRREVRHESEVIDLTPKEFDLLWYLAENRRLVLTRDQIMDAVWEYGYYGESRTVDAHIRQIRKKLGDGFPVRTKWGVGYQLDA